ncbi:MAG: DUF4118 domain-containing protein [Cytophagales bacterium]|nr:MAG: DUF4118 domain-containing protein [Cytophagales bacterium]
MCYFFPSIIGYKLVALILLMLVSTIAMFFKIIPVLVAATSSALIWNYFFIPPKFTFHINNAEDTLLFFLYFAIAFVNVFLRIKIRDSEKKEREKIEKDNTIKLYNTLLNSLSHELRTPIATIIGAVDTLKENKEKISASNQNELLNQIDLASIRLNRQVENLLNMSRLETGMLKLNLDWCDLNELINSVIQKLIYKQTMIFEPIESLPLLKLDSGLMEQIIQNLVHNAINYTPENAVISLFVSQKNNHCFISVSDNGNGIPEKELDFIFDKFYRLPHTKTGGSGLGLSIVKGFTEAHLGIVKAENNPDGGVTFTIEFSAEASYINNLKNE